MKENIEFDYLVIIDLWNVDKLKEMGNPLALPNNIDVYESMNKVLFDICKVQDLTLTDIPGKVIIHDNYRNITI